MALEMNLLRAATLPVRLCTSLVLLKGLYFLRIGLYASLVDHESYELSRGHADCALEGIELHTIRSKDLERISQVGDVI